jgi:hypothetical protein
MKYYSLLIADPRTVLSIETDPLSDPLPYIISNIQLSVVAL